MNRRWWAYVILPWLFAGIVDTRSSLGAEENAAALFGALPTFGPASLSPNGKYLAFVASINGTQSVVISEVDAPGKLSRVAFGQSSITSLHWHSDTHIVV